MMQTSRLELVLMPGRSLTPTGKKWQLRYLPFASLACHEMIKYRKVRHWQWLLDTGLPGDFGQIGEWLNQGEVSSCTTCR